MSEEMIAHSAMLQREIVSELSRHQLSVTLDFFSLLIVRISA